jgi:integrase
VKYGISVKRKAQEGTMKNTTATRQSGKGMANGKSTFATFEKKAEPAKYPKTDSRYWRTKVFKPVIVEGGNRREVEHYTARMGWQGQRQSFPLLSGNLDAAATRAAKIYKSLQTRGWEATLKEFSPTHGKPERESVLTVGVFLEEVAKVADVRARTLGDYMRSFRRIVADIEGIREEEDENGKKRSRFDYKKGGRQEWAERVHKVELAEITKERIQQWKIALVNRALGDPLKEKSARTSANSYLRQAKGLFSQKILGHLGHLKFPARLPFDGVDLFAADDMRYSSKIDAGELMRAGQEELAMKEPEQWKILLLAMGAGLRRGEINSLLWRQVDFERGLIRIEATEHFKPKSAKSAGDVEIDPELVAILRGYHAIAKGEFVIEAEAPARPGANYSTVRAEPVFKSLCKWLRSKGVEGLRPIHTLRKEFGSLVCQQAGLYAASRALRHADIGITARHYLDRKERVTVGLGAMLTPANVTPMKADKTKGKAKGAKSA